MEPKKKLILFTDGYPFVNTPETVFIPPELEELKKDYGVSIVACTDEAVLSEGGTLRDGAGTCGLFCYKKPRGKYLPELACLFRALFDPVFRAEAGRIRREARSGKEAGAPDPKDVSAAAHSEEASVSRKLFRAFLYYYWAADFSRWIKKQGILEADGTMSSAGTGDPEDADRRESVICYTYWHNYYLLGLCGIKDRYPGLKLLSRIHGYDLFDDQSPVNDQPFKAFMDDRTDLTLFLSKQGQDYFERRFHTEKNREKHRICRMGVYERSPEIRASGEEFLMVSCASIYPVKHIEGIIEGLAGAGKNTLTPGTSAFKKKPVRWVHFGPGEDDYAASVKKLAVERLSGIEGLTFEFRGYVPNEEVIRFYLEEHPSCFIMTSLSEGSPVSVQEAVSCGIPVIGTDVGGMGELVDGNGILLTDNAAVKDAILRMYEMPEEEILKMKKRSLEIWSERFDREKNLREFSELIGTLQVSGKGSGPASGHASRPLPG
ncbi:MAG: glycosyltransferase [Lachnospiraceae bacterium]|nr:glycosyltransferase [Lachnospiraceae bacterium]